MNVVESEDSSLTICMFSNLFPPVVSGSSTQVAALSRELSARGHKVVVITAKTAASLAEFEMVGDVHVYRLPAVRLPVMQIALNFPWLSWTFLPANVRRIERILTEHRPDVLHLHNHMFDLGFSAVLMRRRLRLPLAVTIHTMIKHARPIFNSVLYPLDRLFLRFAVIRNCDTVISPDVNIRHYVEQAWDVRTSEIVPYGISIPVASPNLAEIKSRYGLHGKRVVLSLGHVHEARNRRDLVESFALVLERMSDAVLLIVGAEATPIPRALAKARGIEHAVVFTGHLPHAEAQTLLCSCDLEAHWLTQDDPAKTSLGVASLEAMAAGKPVLAAANPDTYGEGILRDGENMIVVQPGDHRRLANAIIGLLEDDRRRAAIGSQAHDTVRKYFSWDSVCARTITVYENMLNGKSGARPLVVEPGEPIEVRVEQWRLAVALALAWVIAMTCLFLLVNPPLWGSPMVAETPWLKWMQQGAVSLFHRPSRF